MPERSSGTDTPREPDGSVFDPYTSVCPECLEDDIGVADGRAQTYHCPNCDIVIGWSSVIRMKRSQYRVAKA